MSDVSGALAPMIEQLGRHAALGSDDRQALADLPFTIRAIDAGGYVVREGGTIREHLVLLSGFTQRNRLTRTGDRQIVAVQLPGEAVSCSSLFFDRADHNSQALTRAELAVIPRDAFRELVLTRRAIGEAILKMTLIEASIASEWLLNMGCRPAKARVAHLLCELAVRLTAAGLSDGSEYDTPLTQEQMGDALGLTAVHINRMLRQLDEQQLVVRRGKRVRFLNEEALARVAGFNPGYLHVAPARTAEADGRSDRQREGSYLIA